MTSSCAKWIPVSSHICEDQLLGQGVLGLGHLFSLQVYSSAHLPVDTRQDAEDVIRLGAEKKKTIGYLKNINLEKQKEEANSSVPFGRLSQLLAQLLDVDGA